MSMFRCRWRFCEEYPVQIIHAFPISDHLNAPPPLKPCGWEGLLLHRVLVPVDLKTSRSAPCMFGLNSAAMTCELGCSWTDMDTRGSKGRLGGIRMAHTALLGLARLGLLRNETS